MHHLDGATAPASIPAVLFDMIIFKRIAMLYN
jgi:hypothetical protein